VLPRPHHDDVQSKKNICVFYPETILSVFSEFLSSFISDPPELHLETENTKSRLLIHLGRGFESFVRIKEIRWAPSSK
jgi:hypothetical protein